jgi:uncharacterized protein YyaL (SSP411 family)
VHYFGTVTAAEALAFRSYSELISITMSLPTDRNLTGRRPNRLVHENSPYLLQHAYNPVDWYPWRDETFAAAKREDKPIFLSIGYSTCHWCHVMERESFEDPDVAQLMNEAFVSVKVDREERPEIDNVYMKVCQMLTGSGGWPLTIIMTPDQRPFFAATYIPKEDNFGRMGMMSLIPRIGNFWKTRRDEVVKSSEEIVAALQRLSKPASEGALDESVLGTAFAELKERFDAQHGGFGGAPKFPTAHNLIFLLRYWKRHGSPEALEMVEKTLEAMRRGGIYDHVGFGFHRYSTDAHWLVPHFEKMLYDQALLTLACTEACQATNKTEYARTAREILAYVTRDMTSPEGGFYSAEDADSEGVEGKFYLWTEGEIRQLLGRDEADLVVRAFNVSAEGNFTEQGSGGPSGENILHQSDAADSPASRLGVSPEEFETQWQGAREKLFQSRERRVHPHKDDKVLADWNGLMIAAFARAAQVFREPQYAEMAGRAAEFVLTRMRSAGRSLLHSYRNGAASIDGNLDDYVFMAWALIELYEATFNLQYFETALDLVERGLRDFWDGERGGFYFTARSAQTVLVRSKEVYDGAVPSGNSVAMLVLLQLARMTGRTEFEDKAWQIARAFGRMVTESPIAYTQVLIGLDFAVGPSLEVVISGDPEADDTRAMIQAVRDQFIPNKVVLLRSDPLQADRLAALAAFTQSQTRLDGKATAYVCQNFRCNLPTTDVGQMLKELGGLG